MTNRNSIHLQIILHHYVSNSHKNDTILITHFFNKISLSFKILVLTTHITLYITCYNVCCR